MWNALSSLTARGYAFVLGGGALSVGAFLLGERDLLRAGLLVALLPLVGAAAMVGIPHRVRHVRVLEPRRVPLGSSVRVRLLLRNTGRRRSTSALRLTETLPLSAGASPRFALGRLAPEEQREVTYRLRPHARGRFPIGPLVLGVTDPLGCVTVNRKLGATASLLVTPAIVPLPPARMRGDSADRGESSAQITSSSGDEDPVPREYRHGDDLRRVHWRSTARHGRLMVRREEHQWLDRSTVLLDLRRAAHSPGGQGSSVETSVSVAASIAVRLLTDGHELRMLTDTGEAAAQNRADAVLDALAVAETSAASSLRRGIAAVGDMRATGRGKLVAIPGALDTEELEALARAARDHEGRCVVVLNSRAAWAGPEAPAAAGDRLARAGWRVLTLSAAEELAEKWAAPVHRVPPVRPGG